MASGKTALRAMMRRHRRALAAAGPDAGERAALLLPLDRLPPFRVAAGYQPIGSEIDPWPLLGRVAGLGASIALPVTIRKDAPLIFREAGAPETFIPDAFGIPGPPVSAAEVVPDLIIAPVLAFDAAGGRLGQGAGSYDRTLAAMRAAGPVFVLGLARAGQEIACVPTDDYDQPLDAILTEIGYRAF